MMSLGMVPDTTMASQGAAVRKATKHLGIHAQLSSSEPSCEGTACVQRKRSRGKMSTCARNPTLGVHIRAEASPHQETCLDV